MKIDKFISFFLIVSQAFAMGLVPEPVYAQTVLPITAPSAILIDQSTNRILFSKTPHIKRPPASTTKILTAIVALDTLNPDQTVAVPSFVTGVEPSKAHLQPGERFYVRDLVRAALISSANDAAETLGHYGGKGSRLAFANRMNQKVRSLGGRHSHFVRASGLPAVNQYSTAYDLALVMREAERYPLIVESMKIKTMTIYSTAGRPIRIKNHNKMLWRQGRRVLGKTGWTRSARHCFVGVINHQGREIFVSMLGSRRLWNDLTRLANYPGRGSGYQKPKRSGQAAAKREENLKIQRALKKAGFYQGALDGQIGPQTRKAVRKFQKAKRLPVTGQVGPRTRKKLQPYF